MSARSFRGCLSGTSTREHEMRAEDFKSNDRVAYIPGHAHGDVNHKDVEHGTVSSQNGVNVFVRFDKQVIKFGWDGGSRRGVQIPTTPQRSKISCLL